MTLHWTIISNELTQKFFCPISDICKNGWYLLLRRTIR